MKHVPIKLGPLALLLTVISICMTTLGILAFATARADWNLAQKYADTVQTRYTLEARGQGFLRDAAKACQEGKTLQELADTRTEEDGIFYKTLGEGEFRLKIGIVSENGSFRVVSWRIQREWEPEGGLDLWMSD